MTEFIYNIPNAWLLFLLNAFTVFFSIFSVLVIEKWVPFHFRYKENQVLGYVSSTICLIFAVLAGFGAIYVLTNFNEAEEVVQREANMAMEIYQNTGWLQDPLRSSIRDNIKIYLKSVINHDWPLMVKGREVGLATDLIINTIIHDLHQYRTQPDISFALQDISHEANSLRNARAERLLLVDSALGPYIWLVIVLTAFLTVAINYPFEMQLHLHLICVSAVSMVVGSMIFLLLVLDHPFKGEFSVGPEAFQYNLNFITRQEQIGR